MFKLKKINFSVYILLIYFIMSFLTRSVRASENAEFQRAPLSPQFLEWQKEREKFSESKFSNKKDGSNIQNFGTIPNPKDFSHLKNNLPKTISPLKDKDNTIPSKYDLRDEKRIPTQVRDQGSYNTCWVHAAIGALESSYMTQKFTSLGTEPNLSELHMAWFVYKDSEAGHSFTLPFPEETVLAQGGFTLQSSAYLGRMAGPVKESSMPYGVAGDDSKIKNYVGDKKPTNYPTALRMLERMI